jgi:CIC family chloride channel protein
MKHIFGYINQKKLKQLLDKFRLTEHSFMFVLALFIGIAAGFSAVGIRWFIHTVSSLSFPGPGSLLENILQTPWYIILIVPVIGGLVVGPIIYYLAPEAKGHGVPEVMQAILQKGGAIRPRVAFVKAVASAITIGTGGSVGREGPIIQIGAGLGSTIGQFFKVHSSRLKILVGCGSAAGIAAAFNAPIAGALFAVEIILMDFAISNFSPIVISSVTATVISHHFEGNYPAFPVPPYNFVSPWEMVFYVVLGIACGLVAFLFIKSLYYSEDLFDNKFKFPPYLKPAIGGIILGGLALISPQILGIGYETIQSALSGKVIWYLAFGLMFMKVLATSITLGSGSSGGIFSPSLFMGVMTGSFLGYIFHSFFPEITATPGAYALVAMGGLIAGTTRAPLTAIIIVFEMTKDYNIILPLMITCIISLALSSLLSRESIYTLKLVLRNIHVKEGTDTNILKNIRVKDVYMDKFDYVNVGDNFNLVVNKIIRGKGSEFPVLDNKGSIHGVISINDVKIHFFERETLKNLLIATDICNLNYDTITLDEDCEVALDKLRMYDFEELPVVEEKNSKKVIGMIWAKDIQDAYQKEIEKREMTASLASSITMKQPSSQVRFMEGYSITELAVPLSFIGKTIKELEIRKKYGVDILSIKSASIADHEIKVIPEAGHVFAKDEIMIVAGEIGNINVLKNLN